MTDIVARIAAVIVVLIVAQAVAFALRRAMRPRHPDVTVGEGGERPGVVFFSSTDCSTCRSAIDTLRTTGVDYREFTGELEAHRFEEWRVVAVPLTVIVDAAGEVTDAIPGVPPARRLSRALSRAGIEATR